MDNKFVIKLSDLLEEKLISKNEVEIINTVYNYGNPDIEINPINDEERALFEEELYSINECAIMYFHEYLSFKGVSESVSNKIINLMEVDGNIGWADSKLSLYNYLRQEGYADIHILASGLVKKVDGVITDKFKDRLMIPLYSEQYRCIGFIGRTFDLKTQEPKYLCTGDTLIFRKSDYLYGLEIIDNTFEKVTRGLIICEGVTDVLTLRKYGVDNSIALLGTQITTIQAMKINQKADVIYLCLDMDGAGKFATAIAIGKLYCLHKSIRIVNLNPYKDADEFLRNLGADEFKQRLSSSIDGNIIWERYWMELKITLEKYGPN